MASVIHPPPYVALRSRAKKCALITLLLLATCCASTWYGRAVLLRGLAQLWIVSDPAGPADAAVIFGGGLLVRPFSAASYYKEGLTTKILISNVRPDKAETLGILPSPTDMNRTVLTKLGIPGTAIEIFGSALSNTYQEAVALRDWVVRTHARSVIIPTEVFSSRRVRWIVDRELSDIGVKVHVVAVDNTEYGVSAWWKDEKAAIEFQNEIIKYIYYRIKY
jgi:uncharacterized SAM-binding protein YcdF (DUF218 family)